MPCLDGRDDECRTPTPNHHPDDLKKIKELEASLCALLNEVTKITKGDVLIKKASHNGKIDIMKFWDKHKKEDEARLKKDLKKYSQHELDLIKKLLG